MMISSRRGRFGAFLCAFLMTVGTASAQKQSQKHMLWRVTGKANTLYLLGSVHALPKTMYPLDSAIERAYKDAGKLVFELDLDSAQSPAAMQSMVTSGMLMGGKSLKASISKSTYKLVQRKFKEAGLSLEMFSGFKPWVVALMYSAMHMQTSGVEAEYGIDNYFAGKAKADGKSVIGLETVAFQIGIFDSMSDKAQEEFLKQSLSSDNGSGDKAFKSITDAWKIGDTKALEKMLGSEIGDDEFNKKMVSTRNANWVPQIEKFLTDKTNYMVVVGSLHLVGENGVVQLLKAKGYQIEQL
ncbi:MAG: TraB/GumN family protein [Bacteroidota bacterium]